MGDSYALFSVTATLLQCILSTEAGLGWNDISSGTSLVEQCCNGCKFIRCISTGLKTEFQTEKAPHVVFPEFDVGSVNLLRLFDVALLKEQRAENMADWLHLTPRFVVCEVERKINTTAQLIEGCCKVMFLSVCLRQELSAVFDFSLKNRSIDIQD